MTEKKLTEKQKIKIAYRAMIDCAIKPYTIKAECKIFEDLYQLKPTKEELCEAIVIGNNAYIKRDDKNVPIQTSVDQFLNKLCGILFNLKAKNQDPELFDFFQSLRKKITGSKWQLSKLSNTIKMLRKAGVKIEVLYTLLLQSKNRNDFEEALEKFIQTLPINNEISKEA